MHNTILAPLMILPTRTGRSLHDADRAESSLAGIAMKNHSMKMKVKP